MAVFGLELLIFWSWFRIWTWKYWFPKFLIFFSLGLTHTVHFACMRWRGSKGDDHEISSFWPQNSYQNINLDQIKKKTGTYIWWLFISFFIKIVIFLWPICRSKKLKWWLLSSVESSRCSANWQTRFRKLKLKSNKLVDLRNLKGNRYNPKVSNDGATEIMNLKHSNIRIHDLKERKKEKNLLILCTFRPTHDSKKKKKKKNNFSAHVYVYLRFKT